MNITQYILRNATSFFFFGPHNIGAKALKTKWMHLFGTNLKVFAEVLKKINGYGVRSYATRLARECANVKHVNNRPGQQARCQVSKNTR